SRRGTGGGGKTKIRFSWRRCGGGSSTKWVGRTQRCSDDSWRGAASWFLPRSAWRGAQFCNSAGRWVELASLPVWGGLDAARSSRSADEIAHGADTASEGRTAKSQIASGY